MGVCSVINVCYWTGDSGVKCREISRDLVGHFEYRHPINRSDAQIPQCTSFMSHNAPFCNRNVHTCAHFCYKTVHCGMWGESYQMLPCSVDVLMHCGICGMGRTGRQLVMTSGSWRSTYLLLFSYAPDGPAPSGARPSVGTMVTKSLVPGKIRKI